MEQEIKSLIDTFVSIFNVIGPFIIYTPQYLLMGKNKSIGSFSHIICYIMIFAHILRLIFHQMINYHISLYIQSYFMIIIHAVLLFQFIRVNHYERLRKNFDSDISVSSEAPQNDLELMDCQKPSKNDKMKIEINESEDSDRGSKNFSINREDETLEEELVKDSQDGTSTIEASVCTDNDNKESTLLSESPSNSKEVSGVSIDKKIN